jgi:hypothetical protein
MHNGGHCNARWKRGKDWHRYNTCHCELSKDQVLLLIIEKFESAQPSHLLEVYEFIKKSEEEIPSSPLITLSILHGFAIKINTTWNIGGDKFEFERLYSVDLISGLSGDIENLRVAYVKDAATGLKIAMQKKG